MKQGSLISKLIALIATATLLIVGWMFFAVLLVFLLSAGLIIFGWIWWKTRALRRQLRVHKQFRASAANDAEAFHADEFTGDIIEGEVIRKVVSIEEIKRRPDDL